MRMSLRVAAALSFALFLFPIAAQPACGPGERPVNGSCNSTSGRGVAGDTFLRVDGQQAPIAGAPRARELSNLFFAQKPFAGIDPFETVLIPLDSLRDGQNPQRQGGYRLNQLAIAYGQAVTHDLTKVRIGFNPAAISAPDFQYAAGDPLCQKIAETSTTTLYYFPCAATSSSNGVTTTVTLDDSSRFLYVDGTSWTWMNGPFSVQVPNNKFVHRRSTFPLATTLTSDGSSLVPINDVTSFLDLSIIYGNNNTVLALLRANDGSGKLETAADGNIPFGKPGLANDCGLFDPVSNPSSASGDPRVDENLFLDAVHSLLFRNHNRDAEWVAANRPDLTTDEQRFQRARAINIARYQQQVYNELLPALFGPAAVQRYLGSYSGHDAGIDPRITSTFDIALRVVHGQVALPPYIVREDGSPVVVEGTLGFPLHSRPNCLFTTFREVGGKAIAISAMKQAAQAVNGEVSDLMRNIVFRSGNNQGTAGFNLDIEQLNIIRGREFATPNFDALRAHWRGASVYDLPACDRGENEDPLPCFLYVSKTPEIAGRLQSVYKHVDRIDAFVGLMLESNADSEQHRFPQTAAAIILDQFAKTRAADRFYYQNSANSALDFSETELARIHETVAQSLALSYGITGVTDAFETIK
jgi:hypothetical protein